MSTFGKKSLYIGIIGLLTCTTVSASYWQYKRYKESRENWNIIGRELSKTVPDALNFLEHGQRFPLRYVRVEGMMNKNYMLVSRARDGRVGNLVVRVLEYPLASGKEKILAVEGWIPEGFNYEPKEEKGTFKGILREKEKTDYIHQKMKAEDLEKYKVSTFIDVDKSCDELKISKDNLVTEYYFEILKDLDGQSEQHYPYQYSVDNFQLPYLTPDKHRAYSMFWGLTSCVGIGAILKVIKMK